MPLLDLPGLNGSRPEDIDFFILLRGIIYGLTGKNTNGQQRS
jgi:hypothetical protein